MSNNYSANNIDQVGALARAGRGAFSNVSAIDLTSLTYVDAENGVPNAAGWAIPTDVHDSVSTGVGSNFEINYLDPDFKIPSDWKAAFGATWTPDISDSVDWLFQGDLFFSQSENSAVIKRGDLDYTGTTRDQTVTLRDGTTAVVTVPVFASNRMASFVLTNADKGNEAFVASLGASANFDNGLGLTLGYAYSDAKDIQPMTSSVAFSNYNNRAFVDPQAEVLSTSNYNIKHRFTGSMRYSKDFWEDYDTNLFMFFQHSSGRPYSQTFSGANQFYNFNPFLGGNSILLPGTERNQFEGPSWTKVDLKIAQDLPGFREDDRAQVFMVIDNFTNFLDSDWGVLRSPSFPRTLVNDQVIQSRNQSPTLVANPSVYEIRFGASYDF